MIKKSMPELCRMGIEDYRQREKMRVCVVADNVRAAHNVGAMFRSADAFLISPLILCGITPVPPSSDIRKTALGAEESVEWRYEESTLKAVRELKRKGWKICALEQTHGSVELNDYLPSGNEKYAIVVGNEVEGVSEEVLKECDVMLEIPQQGTKHSLNVSVSAALAMYTFFLKLEK